jgi:hypothetical protein
MIRLATGLAGNIRMEVVGVLNDFHQSAAAKYITTAFHVRISPLMKRLSENRKQAFRRAIVLNYVLGSICLLIGSLLPLPSSSRESHSSNQAGISACLRFDRAAARAHKLSLTENKAPRRHHNFAAATSSSWATLIRFKSRFARNSYSEANYSSIQISHPSGRAPPQFTT